MEKTAFETRLKGKTVLADFTASWCGPCRAMAPVIRALEKSFRGRVTIMEMDIDNEKELATDYMVHSIPTLILFQDGVEKRRFVGLQSGDAIEEGLDGLI